MSQVLSYLLSGAVLFGVTAAPAFADEDAELIAQGQQVFTDICFACHGTSADGPDRIAPPIFAAKDHYGGMSQEDFVASVSAYILAPSPQITRMPGAIRRFGVMPDQGLSPDDAIAVAEYLWATDFTEPDWYAAHILEEHGDEGTSGN